MTSPASEIEVFSAADRLDAALVREEIEGLLDSIQAHQIRLATNYVQLGTAMLKAQDRKLWIDWEFRSWGSFVVYVCKKIGRERSQLYAVVSTTQLLLSSVSENDLNAIGISKAQELARFVKQSGRSVPDSLLELAKNETTTVEQLHAAVLEELHEKGEERGKWWDYWGGSYFLPDEKQEVLDAMRVARLTDPPISDTDPDHTQRKAILLKFAREFAGTYAHEVEQ